MARRCPSPAVNMPVGPHLNFIFEMRFLSWAAKTALPLIAAATVASVATSAVLARERLRRARESRIHAANRHRERATKVAEMDLFSDLEFQMQYRMSRTSFNALLELIEPLVARDA